MQEERGSERGLQVWRALQKHDVGLHDDEKVSILDDQVMRR